MNTRIPLLSRSARSALALAAATCCAAAACTGTTPEEQLCAASTGTVSGGPSVEIGTGARTFIPRADGDRWLAGYGPQGGAHLWLSFKSQGIGPNVTVSYQMTETDGGVIYPIPDSAYGKPVKLCPSAAQGGGQQGTGVQGFIDYTFPEACSRIMCHGPFRVSLTVEDSEGRRAMDSRLVSGVDLGDTLDSTSPPDCSAMVTCEDGIR